MTKKKILIIGAGLEQSLVIGKAREMGIDTISIDSNPDAYAKDLSDEFYVGDIRDENFIISIMKQTKANGLLCHAVDIPITIAKVCNYLNLKTSTIQSVITATDKILRMQKLKENGISCAHFSAINNIQNLYEFWDTKSSDSIILKPIDNSGSRGVIKIDKKSELENSYKYTLQFTRANHLIAEEFLTGHEISTESIILNGKIYTFAIADRNYSKSKIFHPYFVEDGINYPSILNSSLIKEVEIFIEKTIRALGLTHGVAKGDILIKDNLPYLIEMAPRSSGGWFGAGSMKFATGVDYLEILINMAMGVEISEASCIPKFSKPCAQRYYIPTENGVVNNIQYPSGLDKYPNVKMLNLFLPKIGDTINKAQNHSQRYAQVICTAESLDKAIESCENVISSIKIELDNE